jgi:hypothetical protein
MAVILAVLPTLHWTATLPLGMATAALLLSLGWLQDRLQAPRHLAALAPPMQGRRDVAALLGITGLVLLVFAVAVTVEGTVHIPLSRAILVSLPLVGLGWLLSQYLDYGLGLGARLAGRRLLRNAATTFPNYRTEIAILSSAGFIGTLFSALVPPEWLGGLLSAPALPPLILPFLAMLVVVVPGLLGVNPIVTVTVLASGLATLPILPIPGEVVAVSLMAGWSLAINSSALTASAMLLGEVIHKPAEVIVYRWNGPFTAVALGVLGVWLACLSVVLA